MFQLYFFPSVFGYPDSLEMLDPDPQLCANNKKFRNSAIQNVAKLGGIP
jgi:hypothetical protein